MAPKVSVVLPVFNGEATVARAIQSVQAQTLEDFELLIFDDGSTDQSVEICRRYAAEDDRVRLVRTGPNVGLGGAMNALCSHARCGLIAVQEQDDRSTPDRLRLQVAAFKRRSDAGLVAGISSWRDNEWNEVARHPAILTGGGQYPSSKEEMVRLLYLGGCVIENSTVMVRDALVRGQHAIRFAEARLSSVDWQFFVEAAHRTRIVGLHEVISEMDRGSHHHISAESERLFRDMSQCIDDLMKMYGSNPESPISPKLRRHAHARVYARHAQVNGVRTGGPHLARSFLMAPTNHHSRSVLGGWLALCRERALSVASAGGRERPELLDNRSAEAERGQPAG